MKFVVVPDNMSTRRGKRQVYRIIDMATMTMPTQPVALSLSRGAAIKIAAILEEEWERFLQIPK